MGINAQQRRRYAEVEATRTEAADVGGEGLVIRNYDGNTIHEVDVRLTNPSDDVVHHETYRVPPRSVRSIAVQLPRDTYVAEAQTDNGSESQVCLIGPAIDEMALVELGNGLVSVADGLY